jgi:hypothetical protein
LLRLFQDKVDKLRETLNDDAALGEAANILSTPIETVTIYPEGPHGLEAKAVAKASDLMAFATNDNASPRGAAHLVL